jgi:pimeloyl-ACP methyl ester carboxylesterase
MLRLLWLLPLLLLLPVAGILYQKLGALKDRRRFLGLGSLIDVGGGLRMYLSGKGAGEMTVIFESGIAATSQNWAWMQEAVSGGARTVSYDRLGLGWSSASPSERTPSNIARELHTLLQQAGIPPPYVLVGHSFGGLVARRFATEYADEVAGVVLVDAMRLEDWPPLNESQRPLLERGLRLTAIAVPIARFGLARLATTSLLCRSGRTSRALSRAAGAGGRHVLDRITCEIGKMPPEVWPIVAAHWSTPAFYRGLAAHVRAVPATVQEMQNADPIEGIPLVVLTAGTSIPLSPEALRRIGPAAEQIIATNSGHWIHLDEPTLVLEAIRCMVQEVRTCEAEAVEVAG